MHNLIKIAAGEIGVREIPGDEHSDRILRYAEEAGFDSYNTDEVPWCSVFMNWCAKKAKLVRSNKLNARSWLTVGLPIDKPELGDIVIFWRENLHSWKGHVGVYMGFSSDHDRIYCLGGNQNNQVSITAYPTERLLGFRRLVPQEKSNLPIPPLAMGNTGEEVAKLQDMLKILGFNCGTSDGIFGSLTEYALKHLQSSNDELAIDGEYDENDRNFLNTLI